VHRGDPEVEQDPGHGGDAELVEHLRERVEPGAHQIDAPAAGRSGASRSSASGEGDGIAVEADE
jgi:hypothetical protein